MDVRKSDNTVEEYCVDKVKHGICNAYESAGEECNDIIIDSIVKNLFIYDQISTSEIRRQVEESLMSLNKKVAKEYIKKFDNIESNDNQLRKKDDFIKNYIIASNAATGSKFDSNANVSNKNVVTMGQELYKEDNIKQNRWILYDRIKSMYSKKLAKQYIEDLTSHVLYKHDETAIPGMPYTYSSKETVEVKYNNKHLFLPFDLLWDILDEEAFLINDLDGVWQKYPQNLFVKDRDNAFTHVSVMTRKIRKRDLVRVKTSFGEDVVVTDNHPMIIDENNINVTIDAVNSEGYKQFKINDVLEFDGKKNIDMSFCPDTQEITDEYCINYSNQPFKRYLNVDEELGYFVGFFVGDGNYNNGKNNGSIVFTQKNRDKLIQLNNILFKKLGIIGNIRYKRDKTNCYTLTIHNTALWWLLSEVFKIQDKSENKTLPYNFLEYNEEFANGLLGGLIDADGTVNDNQLTIRLSSRAAILQATALLRHFGYGIGNIVQNLPFSNNNSYNTNYTLWGVNCSCRKDSVKIKNCDKFNKIRISDSSLKYKKSGETLITKVSKIEDNDSFLSLNHYIYDITTDTRSFALNNILVHNCVAITMYPFLLDGLTKLGGVSTAPTDLKSFCGEFINLVYSISSQFAGAVATPEFLMYMDYFIRKDYGEEYLNLLNTKVEFNKKGRTLEKVIENCFQQIVHSMNMPAGNRGYQTVFWNVGYFDKPYFEGVFGDFVFPDGTKPKWETLSWLQKKFMKWFNDERSKYVLTFPVETMAMLTNGNDMVDEEYGDFTAEMWSEGHSFFCYLSDSPDSLSSCCFSKEQMVLVRDKDGVHNINFSDLYALNNNKKLQIFHNGNWVLGKVIKLPNRDMYEITTSNNKSFVMSDNHINVTNYGEKLTKELTTNDYLLFNTKKLDGIIEKDENLTYEEGFVIGLVLGNSFNEKNNKILLTSQDVEEIDNINDKINVALKQLGANDVVINTNISNISIESKILCDFIKKWVINNENYQNINLNVLEQSYSFRLGIIEGLKSVNCINVNKCYANNAYLANNIEVILTSLGYNSIISNNKESSDGDTIYCIKWYDIKNRKQSDVYVYKNNSIYFRVKSIKKVNYTDDIYCFEMENDDEPYFTLPNGLITHNCRLRNSLKDNVIDDEHNHTTHQFSMGTASVATGSKSVMTINLNRVVQNAVRKYLKDNSISFDIEKCNFSLKEIVTEKDYDFILKNKDNFYEYIKDEIRDITERVHKYQAAFNDIIKDFLKANMLDVYSAGFIDMRKQYLTIGVNGLTDAAEFLNLTISNNDEYKNFVNTILETINICNSKDKTRELMYNTEFVPGENLSVKNYNWDKKDGYYVSNKHEMYSSYFFNPEDEELSILDKMKLHGNDYVKWLDGGSACHINIQEHLSKEQYRQLLKVAAKYGTNYFTFNCRNTICNECGYISKDTLDICPKCGSKNLDYLTRIIGYLKRISSFSESRQKEAAKRAYNSL